MRDKSDIVRSLFQPGEKIFPLQSLTKAFESADTLSYGPIAIRKAANDDWTKALVSINGHELKLGPQQKVILALMMSHPGERIKPINVQYETGQKATGMKVHICNLKKTIRDAGYPEYAGLIVSANTNIKAGQKAKWDKNALEAYKIITPESLNQHMAFVWDPKADEHKTEGLILVHRHESGVASTNYTFCKPVPKQFNDSAACAAVSLNPNSILRWRGPLSEVAYYGKNNPQHVFPAIKLFSRAP